MYNVDLSMLRLMPLILSFIAYPYFHSLAALSPRASAVESLGAVV